PGLSEKSSTGFLCARGQTALYTTGVEMKLRRLTLRRRSTRALLVLVVAASISVLAFGTAAAAGGRLPTRLGDQEFWQLIEDLSEQGGSFRSDNLLSNEARFQFVIPELLHVAEVGRVYLGVGPEQNFTYIAAVKPALAFIVDIRRANLDLHL